MILRSRRVWGPHRRWPSQPKSLNPALSKIMPICNFPAFSPQFFLNYLKIYAQFLQRAENMQIRPSIPGPFSPKFAFVNIIPFLNFFH